MSYYYSRQDLMDQATTTFGAVETALDGSTAGAIRVPQGVTAVTKITAAYTIDGAHTTITGTVAVVRIGGPGSILGNQDLVIAAEHMEDGGGTLTYTTAKNITPTVIPVFIPVRAGNDLTIQAAYYGVDSGNGYLGVTLELS